MPKEVAAQKQAVSMQNAVFWSRQQARLPQNNELDPGLAAGEVLMAEPSLKNQAEGVACTVSKKTLGCLQGLLFREHLNNTVY